MHTISTMSDKTLRLGKVKFPKHKQKGRALRMALVVAGSINVLVGGVEGAWRVAMTHPVAPCFVQALPPRCNTRQIGTDLF